MKIHYDIIYLVFKYLSDYKIMEYKIKLKNYYYLFFYLKKETKWKQLI